MLRTGGGAGLVVAIMIIGSLVLWVGTPLLWLWIGSQIQGATASLGAALQTAGRLPQNLAEPLVSAAEHAFVDGIHLAAFTGSVLCACAALAVLKFMPHQIEQHGAMHDAVSSTEDMAELGIGGVLPVFADTAVAEDVATELAGG